MKSGSFLLFFNDRYYFVWRDGENISYELDIVQYLNAVLFLITTTLLGRYYSSYVRVEEMKAQRE